MQQSPVMVPCPKCGCTRMKFAASVLEARGTAAVIVKCMEPECGTTVLVRATLTLTREPGCLMVEIEAVPFRAVEPR
jgi:hypothetical protein